MADLIRSPFPGMDPYLEAHPGDVIAALTVYVADTLNPLLAPDLVARIRVLPNRRRLVRIIPITGEESPISIITFRHPDDGLSCTFNMAGVEWQGSNPAPACVINLFRYGLENTDHPYCCLLIGRGEAEMVSFPLRERLPEIRVPLRRGDPDAVLELQPLVDRAYYFGAYHRSTRYTRDPHPPLTGDDARWADELLKAAGKR